MNSIATHLRRMQDWVIRITQDRIVRGSSRGDSARSIVTREIEAENRLAQETADVRKIA